MVGGLVIGGFNKTPDFTTITIKASFWGRLLSDVVGYLMLSLDNPLGLHAKILSPPEGAAK